MKILKLFKRKNKNNQDIKANQEIESNESVEEAVVEEQQQVEESIEEEQQQVEESIEEEQQEVEEPIEEEQQEVEEPIEEEQSVEESVEEEQEVEEPIEEEQQEVEEPIEEEQEVEETIEEEQQVEEKIEEEQQVEESIEEEQQVEESVEEEQQVEESVEEQQQVEESIEEEQQVEEKAEEDQQHIVGTTEFEIDATQTLGMIDDDDMYTTNIGYIEEESDFNFSQGWVKYDLNENDQFKNVYFNVDRDQYIESFQTHAIQVETIPYINDIFKQIHNNLTSEYQAMSETYKLTNQYYHDLAPSNTFLMYRFEPYTKGGKIKKNCYIVSFDCSVEGRNDLWRGTLFFNRQEELQMANIEIVDKNKVSHKIKVECKYVKSTSRVDTYKYTSSGKRLKKAEFNSNNANHLHIKKGQKLPQWSNYTEEQMQRFKELLTSKSVSDSQKEQVRAKIIENVKEDEIQFNIIYK